MGADPQKFGFDVVYRPGSTNVITDTLSRAPAKVAAAAGKRWRARKRVVDHWTTATTEDDPHTTAEVRTARASASTDTMDSIDGPDKVMVVETAATAGSVPPGKTSDVARESGVAMDVVDKRSDTREASATNVVDGRGGQCGRCDGRQ